MTLWTLRRYQAALLIVLGILLGSASLFSRDSEFFATQPRYPHRLALTFDDGPHPAFTDRLLEVLRRERVAATFFVVGKQVERYPELLREIARHGHELANHTYGHPNLARMSSAEVSRELIEAHRVIRETTGVETVFFRPPGGRFDLGTLETASRLGYRTVLWTVFPQDHLGHPPERTYDRVMAAVQDGGVVLLHSGVESTLRVLPRLIRDLRERGYQFLTISEMLEEGIDPRTLASWYLPKRPLSHDEVPAESAPDDPLSS
jgi:peptidoglycan-N-acetylglucosamine deacetylase